MADGEKTIEIEVLRYRPEQDKGPFWQGYKVPFTDDMSVLQALQYVKDDLDSTLSFRWSCRMAICGSCGMMIQGVPKLACRTFLRNYHHQKLRVGPLEHFPIERDRLFPRVAYAARSGKMSAPLGQFYCACVLTKSMTISPGSRAT